MFKALSNALLSGLMLLAVLLTGCTPETESRFSANHQTDSTLTAPTNELEIENPEACPAGFTRVVVSQEGSDYILYGVIAGVIVVRQELGNAALLTLGETNPAEIKGRKGTTLELTEYDLTSMDTCLGQHFVSGLNRPWTDGATLPDVLAFDADIRRFGFQVPDFLPTLVATASGTMNNRLLYGQERDMTLCEADDMNPPASAPIGSYPDCSSAFGLADQMSYWARMDCASLDAWSEYGSTGELDCDAGAYVVVAGPNARTNTFYYPGTFGIHYHTEEDTFRYADDRVAYLETAPFNWSAHWAEFSAYLAAFTGFESAYSP